MAKKDKTGKNKCQVTVVSNLAYRYRQTNHKSRIKTDIKTFEVKYPSQDQSRGNNTINIIIDEYGWDKSFIGSLILAFVSRVVRDDNGTLTDTQIDKYKQIIFGELLIDINDFIRFPLLSTKEQDNVLIKYSNRHG